VLSKKLKKKKDIWNSPVAFLYAKNNFIQNIDNLVSGWVNPVSNVIGTWGIYNAKGELALSALRIWRCLFHLRFCYFG